MADAKVTLSLDIDAQTGKITVVGQELGELSKSTTAAGNAAKESTEKVGALGQAYDELKGKLAALVGLAAIEEFFRKSVTLAIEDEEAHRKLKGAVEGTGLAYSAVSKELNAYAEAQQASTRFDKTETLDILQRMIRVSGDVAQGIAATTLAENIAASGAVDLGTATQLVTSLLAGKQRGLMMVRQELGNFIGDTNDTTVALQKLQEHYVGTAQAQEGFSKSFAQSKNAIGEFMKDVGGLLLPMLKGFMSGLATLAARTEEFGVVWADMIAVVEIRAVEFGKTFVAIMTHNFEVLPGIVKKAKADIEGIESTSAERLVEIENRRLGKVAEILGKEATLRSSHQKEAKEESTKIQDEMVQKYVQATEDEYRAEKVALDRTVAAAEAAGIKEISFVESGVTKTITLAQYRESQLKRIFDKETNDIVNEEMKKQAAAVKTDKMREFLQKKEVKDTESTLAFISTLQNAHNAELVALGKAAAIARATIATYEGSIKAYDALAGIPLVGPELGALAAAAVITAGIADVAQISGAQLEVGGVVPGSDGGTRATIGEKGKSEAVLPLDDPRAMAKIKAALAPDGGGDGANYVFNMSFNLPGIEAFRDGSLVDAVLASFVDSLKRRSPTAIQFARLSADAATLNGRKAY